MRQPLLIGMVTIACCAVQYGAAFPRTTRQSFFRCSGWGAGCTNMDYTTASRDPGAQAQASKIQNSGKSFYNMPYLFTSGRSWTAIGKRWGPTSWHSDPYLRRILLPYMLSANDNLWVRHYFPDEYLAFKKQFGRSTNVLTSKERRASQDEILKL